MENNKLKKDLRKISITIDNRQMDEFLEIINRRNINTYQFNSAYCPTEFELKDLDITCFLDHTVIDKDLLCYMIKHKKSGVIYFTTKILSHELRYSGSEDETDPNEFAIKHVLSSPINNQILNCNSCEAIKSRALNNMINTKIKSTNFLKPCIATKVSENEHFITYSCFFKPVEDKEFIGKLINNMINSLSETNKVQIFYSYLSFIKTRNELFTFNEITLSQRFISYGMKAFDELIKYNKEYRNLNDGTSLILAYLEVFVTPVSFGDNPFLRALQNKCLDRVKEFMSNNKKLDINRVLLSIFDVDTSSDINPNAIFEYNVGILDRLYDFFDVVNYMDKDIINDYKDISNYYKEKTKEYQENRDKIDTAEKYNEKVAFDTRKEYLFRALMMFSWKIDVGAASFRGYLDRSVANVNIKTQYMFLIVANEKAFSLPLRDEEKSLLYKLSRHWVKNMIDSRTLKSVLSKTRHSLNPFIYSYFNDQCIQDMILNNKVKAKRELYIKLYIETVYFATPHIAGYIGWEEIFKKYNNVELNKAVMQYEMKKTLKK